MGFQIFLNMISSASGVWEGRDGKIAKILPQIYLISRRWLPVAEGARPFKIAKILPQIYLGSGDLIIYVLNNIWEFDKCRIDSLDEHFDMQDDVWMEWYLLWVDGMIKTHLLHPNFRRCALPSYWARGREKKKESRYVPAARCGPQIDAGASICNPQRAAGT